MSSWILDGCDFMQWAGNGYGIEIKDVPAVSPLPLFLPSYSSALL